MNNLIQSLPSPSPTTGITQTWMGESWMVDGETSVMMVMKISSKSPSQQDARMEFLVLNHSFWWWWCNRSLSGKNGEPPIVSGKSDPSPRFFSLRGLYRRRGIVRRWARQPHYGWARPGAGPRPPVVWLASSPPPSHLRSSRSFGKNRRFGFCFIQFREYFLCNFSKTQKQQKIGNWHCGVLLIG
jgi:hypothetical protein